MAETFVERRKKPRGFLERNPGLLAAIAGICIVLTIVFAFLLKGAYDLQQETLTRFDRPVGNLLGPEAQIGWRSRRQIDILSDETPGIQGVWVTRLKYERGEYPIIHSWVKHDAVRGFLDAYRTQQMGPNSVSSADLDKNNASSVRNSVEAKTGLIKCGKTEETTLPKVYPPSEEAGKVLCRASLPPFTESVNMAIVALVDSDDPNSPKVKEVRRTLLRLQIDIFNREFQGRETWARSIN